MIKSKKRLFLMLHGVHLKKKIDVDYYILFYYKNKKQTNKTKETNSCFAPFASTRGGKKGGEEIIMY